MIHESSNYVRVLQLIVAVVPSLAVIVLVKYFGSLLRHSIWKYVWLLMFYAFAIFMPLELQLYLAGDFGHPKVKDLFTQVVIIIQYACGLALSVFLVWKEKWGLKR